MSSVLKTISLRRNIPKILKRCIEQQMWKILQLFNIIPLAHSEFYQHCSCTIAVSNVTDDVFHSVDKGYPLLFKNKFRLKVKIYILVYSFINT